MTITSSTRKLFAVLGLAVLSQLSLAQTAIPDYIQKAVASPERAKAMTDRDALRHPAETLVLSGIKPGDSVVEFAGFGQYYTTLLSAVVGDKGKVAVFDLPYLEGRTGPASREFAAKHPNTVYTNQNYDDITLPANVDIVYNVLYYHDLSINKIDIAKLNKKIFAALKPGGVFFIIDHNAVAGSGRRDTDTLHRIDPELIKQEVIAAGFKLETESKLLAAKDDDHTWGPFTAGKRGTTDQSVFKFVKPK
ncbi:MAG TPA: hypothetical protein VMH83_12975 [Candidatus Acidoferrum sp.]|nr:hypothetical protein [Candidatus Acidoferrum sp.]